MNWKLLRLRCLDFRGPQILYSLYSTCARQDSASGTRSSCHSLTAKMDALSSRFLSSRCAVILSRTSRLTGSALRHLSPGASAKANVQKPESQQTITRRQNVSRGGDTSMQSEHFSKHCLAMCDVIVTISITVKTIVSTTSTHVSPACKALILLSEVSGHSILLT